MPIVPTRSFFAVQFFLTGVLLLSIAGTCAWFMPRWPELVGRSRETFFPPIFVVSTACLLLVSGTLWQAEAHVMRERQRPFRANLLWALLAGTCFLAVQAYALSAYLSQHDGTSAGHGATQFIVVSVALHAMHVSIAWLFLLYIFLQARMDRYDHEFYRGITYCAWFWHVLGAIWILVLCVIAIANPALVDDGIRNEAAVNRNAAGNHDGTTRESRSCGERFSAS